MAVGDARGVSSARDSLNTPGTPPIAREDWIEGDTVIAHFSRVPAPTVSADSLPPVPGRSDSARADTAAYRLDRLEARVGARSLYRIPPSDSARAAGQTRLALHYVTGDAIVIDLKGGNVESMQVTGPAKGLHLEPLQQPPPPGGDTTKAKPATAGGGGR